MSLFIQNFKLPDSCNVKEINVTINSKGRYIVEYKNLNDVWGIEEFGEIPSLGRYVGK